MSLELPPLVRFGASLFFVSLRGLSRPPFSVFFAHFPEWGAFDYIAHGPSTQVPTIWG